MKKQYEEPQIEIIVLDDVDIVTTSTDDPFVTPFE